MTPSNPTKPAAKPAPTQPAPAIVALDPNRLWIQVAIVLTFAIGLYFFFLGQSGFAFSEGQRVFPGWEMAQRGDWFMPHLFEQPYLRKPPGMPWAVALMSFLLGESEFSARAVSALSITLSALLALLFARRWFGPAWGVIAGLAFLLTPVYWYPGRSAEIEALHNLFAMGAMLVTIELLINRPKARAAIAWSLALAAAIAGMAIVKGPSAIPALAGVLIASVVTTRSLRTLLSTPLISGLALGGLLIALVAWKVSLRLHELPEPPVLQSAEQFLWKPGKEVGVFTLPFTALGAALPWALALPIALVKPKDDVQPYDRLGRTAALAIVIAIAIYTVIGVYNNRYTMPITTLTPLVLAYAGRRIVTSRIPAWGHTLATLTLARRPWIWLVALFMAAIISNAYSDRRRDTRTSGREAGIRLGEFLPSNVELWGDWMLDNRGEVGHYARQRAAELGKTLRVRWMPAGKNNQGDFPIPPPGNYLILLDTIENEPEDQEVTRYYFAGKLEPLELFHTGIAHRFLFRVYRVPQPPDRLVAAPPRHPG